MEEKARDGAMLLGPRKEYEQCFLMILSRREDLEV